MSSNEFRQGRRGNDTTRGGSQRNSSNNTPRDGNASQGQQNRRGGKQQQHNVNRAQQQQQQQQQPTQSAETSAQNGPALPSEQHVPLNGFNAAAIETFLAQGVDAKVPIWKPQTGSEGAKSGNPWGAKPGNMANGRDFWLELRKQVTAAQKQASGGLQGG